MGKARAKAADNRKPKHGLDANRPSTAKKGTRDAATVGDQFQVLRQLSCAVKQEQNNLCAARLLFFALHRRS